MQLITNSVGSSNIRETTENGERYFVAENIPILQAQRLSNGYVPEEHVAESVGEWDVPLTLNHPTNDSNRLVSANTDYGEQVTVGHAENPTLDDDGRVTPDLRINADRAQELGGGGEALVAALENGDGLEVSSQYFADDLPAGEYDGERRESAEGNLDPDSVALLPNDKGVCSLPDCGIAPDGGGAVTANADHLSVTATPADGDAPGANDGLVRRGLALLGAAFDGDATGGASATANCAGACDCGGADDGQESDSDGWADTHDADADDADQTANKSNMVDIDREMLVKAVAKQSNLDQATLEELGDDAIATIYKSSVEGDDNNDNEDGDEDNSEQQQAQVPQQPPTGNNDEGVVVLSANAVPDAVADGEQSLTEHIDERVANDEQENETEETVDQIIANSTEYDDDDRDALLDTDESVLDRIAAGVDTGSDGLPGRSGATANAATPGADGDTDADAYGTGVAEH